MFLIRLPCLEKLKKPMKTPCSPNMFLHGNMFFSKSMQLGACHAKEITRLIQNRITTCFFAILISYKHHTIVYLTMLACTHRTPSHLAGVARRPPAAVLVPREVDHREAQGDQRRSGQLAGDVLTAADWRQGIELRNGWKSGGSAFSLGWTGG